MADTLVDCTTFFIDNNVKLYIGLDPNYLLNCVVYISSNSQCVKMTVEFYQSLRAALVNLKKCSQPSHILILLEELKVVSWVRCHGVNVVSIKCLQEVQDVHLTEENVSRFVQLSDAIEEAVQFKKVKTHGQALLQSCKMSMFLANEMPIPKNTKLEDVEDYLDRIDVGELKERIPFSDPCLIAELKMKARRQLAMGWLASSVEIEVIREYIITYYFKSKEKKFFLA